MLPFEEIVAMHGPAVLRVCRAVVGPDAADDAWSETFIAAMRAYPGLPSDANVEAWLITIAKRKAIDQHRMLARAPIPHESVPERTPGETSLDVHEDLWQEVKALPKKQREALAYHHLAGLPYAEIAKILGNSEAAARRAAADGLKTLRKNYRGEPT